MKISTKGRYALRVMVELARLGGEEYIPLKLISQRQDISMKYLESIVAVLQKAGFLISLRGKSGGYKLARAPGTYTAGSIIKLTEGSLVPVSCLEEGAAKCSRADSCPTLPMWVQLEKVIDDYLESVTLEDLLNNSSDTAGNQYVI